jgi:UDP-2,4-diacetamido-2,4,6-trideoxy-beta-L-altropyranose hydrolase
LKLLVRADASNQKGSGHVMRCLALADGLRPHVTDVHFVCRRLQGDLHRLIEQRGFRCSMLPAEEADQSDDAEPESAVDPSLDQLLDAKQTASLTDTVDWLIVDHYEIDQQWERTMRSVCRRLLVIDDLANRAHDCDILLDQTFGRGEDRYQPLVTKECTVLTGTDYALLRPEFAAQRSAALARRNQCDGVQSVLIAMGGSDPGNKTLEALRTLAGSDQSGRLAVTVVTGAQYADSDSPLTAIAGSFERLDVKHNVSNMAELMAASDLAIGAAGSSAWERCCLGLPALVYIAADNQREVARSLEAAGAIRSWRSASELQEQLEEILNDASLYRSAVTAASGICDGLGVERVVSIMRSCQKIRKARRSDSKQFFTWRNDPLVIASSFTKGEIKMQDHRRWYDQKLNSDDCELYVIEYATEPAGQVRFDIDGSEATINYSLGEAFRGRGLAKRSMNQAIAVFSEEHEDVTSLVAFVKPDNVASCRVFENLNFEFDGVDKKMQANRYCKHLADQKSNKPTGD